MPTMLIPKNTDKTIHALHQKYRTECILCPARSKKQMVNHYVKTHCGSEVYIARLSHEMLTAARRSVHQPTVDHLNQLTNFCYFCEEPRTFINEYWPSHILTHTGEYMFYCNVHNDPILTESSHEKCAGNVEKRFHYTYNEHGLAALVCKLCNYVQVKKWNIISHLVKEHDIPRDNCCGEFEEIILLNYSMESRECLHPPAKKARLDDLENPASGFILVQVKSEHCANSESNTQTNIEICSAKGNPLAFETHLEEGDDCEPFDGSENIPVKQEEIFVSESVYTDDSSMPSENQSLIEDDTAKGSRISMSKTNKKSQRQRNDTLHKRYIDKQKVEKGEAHVTRKGAVIPAKQFQPQVCKCKLNCSTVIEVTRQRQIFDSYYKTMDWSSKTNFLRASVQQIPVKSRTSPQPQKFRDFNTLYRFTDAIGIAHPVCKTFFINCLQIPGSRVLLALKTMKSNPNAVDRRGKHPSSKKISESDANFAMEFIKGYPVYEACYNMKRPVKKYLRTNLSVIKLYKDYKVVCETAQRTVLKENRFRDVFHRCDLTFKSLSTGFEKCQICNDNGIEPGQNLPSLEDTSIGPELGEHIKCVHDFNEAFKRDVDEANRSEDAVQCLTFELQRALPTPYLHRMDETLTKRPLWTYNLCIYDEISKQAYMYVWGENVAGHGAEEIGSCLVYHIKNNLPVNTKHLILYSDSRSQKLSLKLTLILKKLLHNTSGEMQIETIEQKYFPSGHTYNSCDLKFFCTIEKYIKSVKDIFSPLHWQKIIFDSKKLEPRFKVTGMVSKDFYTCRCIRNLCIPKKTIKSQVKWSSLYAITNRKSEPLILAVKENANRPERKIQLFKANVTEDIFCELPLENSHPNGKLINKKKYDDLMDLLGMLPKKCHKFYKNLQYNQNENYDIDFGLASGSSEDDDDDHKS